MDGIVSWDGGARCRAVQMVQRKSGVEQEQEKHEEKDVL